MNPYQPIPYAKADPLLKKIYDDIAEAYSLEQLPNWVTYLGGAPHILQGLWDILRQNTLNSSISPLLQELVLFSIAFNRAVPYCIELHASNLLRLTNTLEYNDLAEIAVGKSNGVIPESYTLAIEAALELSHSECESKTSEKLLQGGFQPVQIIEINGLVALAQVLNTYTIAANLPIDDSIKVSDRWKNL